MARGLVAAGNPHLAINIGAAVMALFFITDVFDWKLGFEDNPVALRWIRVLLAGTGAMAFFAHRCSRYGSATRTFPWDWA